MFEDCVDDGELVLYAELEQEAPVVATVTNTVSSKDSLPGLRVLPNSSIEVAKDEDLLIFRGVVQESPQIGIEDIFVRRVCQKSGSVDTEEREMLFALQW